MKKTNFVLTMLMTLLLFNNAFASFPITKQEVATKIELTDSVEKYELTEGELEAPSMAPAASVDWGLFVVCFFLGGLGIHRFMMGDIAIGVLQLLTLGGLGIWALIDLIRIATGDLG